MLLAFAGGGMPSMPPSGEIRQNHGLSSGVIYMLNHGITADFAIICKPGWAAAWEEVGLCWFKVTVRGQMGYAGMTRSFPNFRNAIVHAATLSWRWSSGCPRIRSAILRSLFPPGRHRSDPWWLAPQAGVPHGGNRSISTCAVIPVPGGEGAVR